MDRYRQTEEREKTCGQMKADRRKGQNSWTDGDRQKKRKITHGQMESDRGKSTIPPGSSSLLGAATLVSGVA
jgi:hypothetical protein